GRETLLLARRRFQARLGVGQLSIDNRAILERGLQLLSLLRRTRAIGGLLGLSRLQRGSELLLLRADRLEIARQLLSLGSDGVEARAGVRQLRVDVADLDARCIELTGEVRGGGGAGIAFGLGCVQGSWRGGVRRCLPGGGGAVPAEGGFGSRGGVADWRAAPRQLALEDAVALAQLLEPAHRRGVGDAMSSDSRPSG